MPATPIRRSPVHDLLEARRPAWKTVGGAAFAARFDAVTDETAAAETLGLCDVSGLPKLGVKGSRAADWLSGEEIEIPATIYESKRLADAGFIMRTAADEFLLESGITGETVPSLSARLTADTGALFRIERQEATYLLTGNRAPDVLAQTCGIDFRQASDERLMLTRVAGVSCGLFPHTLGNIRAWRFWVECSYAVYLWETLAGICEECNGSIIGAACLYPELA